MAKKTSRKKSTNKKPVQRRGKTADLVVVDEAKKLTFTSEAELFQFFEKEILGIEEDFYKAYDAGFDIKEEEFHEYEELLLDTLSDPDEIYKSSLITNHPTYHYLKTYQAEGSGEDIYYVAIVYVADDEPTFVFFHFPTSSISLFNHYKTDERTYDRQTAYEEGDALVDGDPLAMGLYSAMLKIRSEKDIPEADFQKYKQYRDETIEEPDEIWRDPDLQGNILVSFIKDFSEGSTDLFYISVAVEDKTTDSHLLLFSFPTSDRTLVDRYRHGENLHAEEILQSEGH